MDSSGDGTGSSGTNGSASETDGNTTTTASGFSSVVEHMSRNKIETAMWFSRITTLVFTVSFVLPIFGVTQYSSGQKVLIAGGITSALRLHQRMPQFTLNRQYLWALLSEDSAHYLMYSLMMLYSAQPVSMILMPVTLFALLHVTKYTKALLNVFSGPSSLRMIRNLIEKVETNNQMLLKLIATVEISLMPTTVLMVFFGQAALILPFVYYRFLCLRYNSVRNPYSRTVFYELRLLGEHLARHPKCPAFAANLIYKVISFTTKLCPNPVQSSPNNSAQQ